MKAKINELENNCKIKKNIRDLYSGINDFKKGYESTTNIAKDEKGDLVTDCHSILVRWRNHFSYSMYMELNMLDRNTYNRATGA